MKKFTLVFLLGLALSGSALAQQNPLENACKSMASVSVTSLQIKIAGAIRLASNPEVSNEVICQSIGEIGGTFNGVQNLFIAGLSPCTSETFSNDRYILDKLNDSLAGYCGFQSLSAKLIKNGDRPALKTQLNEMEKISTALYSRLKSEPYFSDENEDE